MTSMMLTALDARQGRILNLVELDQRTRDEVHGVRVARSNGYDLVCRQCEHGVHLKVNHLGRSYWQHNPGNASRCILDSIKTSESPEHFAAKYAIAKSIGMLKGWTAMPEQRFELAGEVVIPDVYAKHASPAAHQAATAWEVQLSKQTRGDFIHRTDERLRVVGCRTAWVTPHGDALGNTLGVVSDPTGERIVGRLFTNPYDDVPLPPMPLDQFVNKVARRRGHFVWADAGANNEWIAYPSESIDAERTRPRVGNTRTVLEEADDRLCDRPAPTRPPTPSPPSPQPTRTQPTLEALDLRQDPTSLNAESSAPHPQGTIANIEWPTSECPRCHKDPIAKFHGHCAACLTQLTSGSKDPN